ncbi:MAG: phosphonoacetaldehyde hydrolase [Anaerovoracaceae bacterium]
MKKIKCIIFDWAGTTVDYGSFAPVQAFIEAFEEFGITPTVDEVREPMGMLKWNHIKTMMEMDRIANEWERIYGRKWNGKDVDKVYEASENAIMKILCNFAEPKPFVVDAIKTLRGDGIKIGSTTGYTDEMMEIVSKKANENGYAPDYYCTPNMVKDNGRPYPYMIFKNMETLNIGSTGEVIKVGDTIADIKEGNNAGVISIGVIEGSSLMALTKEEYESLSKKEKETLIREVSQIYFENGADFVIDNFARLPELVREIDEDLTINHRI